MTKARAWRADYAVASKAQWLDARVAQIDHVRDWSYTDSNFPTERPYITQLVDTSKVRSMHYCVEPFKGLPYAAHTFFTFEFEDGSSIALSVEARCREGESYSILRGLLPWYELMYVWSSKRDIFSNITTRLGDELYAYKVSISNDAAGVLLHELIDQTIHLSHTPRVYNSFFTNCANTLAVAVNRTHPRSLPLHHSWVLTGYSAEYLHRLGYLGDAPSFAELKRNARVQNG